MKQILLTLLNLVVFMQPAKSSFLNKADTILHYLYRLPKVKTLHPPVLILLHGVGSNENDLFSFAQIAPDNFLVISARAPYTLSAGSYAWYSVDFSAGKPVIDAAQAEKSRTELLRFLDQLKELHDFDPGKVFLCGFSQGAIMSYSVGLTQPDKIKGIAVLSGRLLDEVKPKISKTEQLKKLQVFIAHGEQDNVLGAHYAAEANLYLKQLGIIATTKLYNHGHTIDHGEIVDLMQWLKTVSE